MKKKLLYTAFAAFISAVWLFPFRFDGRFPAFAAALFAVFALLLFVPNKYVSFGLAAALCAGMSIFDIRFLWGFAPSAAWLCAFFSVAAEQKPLPARKDSFFLTMLLFTGLFSAASVIASVSALAASGIPELTPQRYEIWLVGLAVLWILLAARAYGKQKASAGRAARAARDAYRKRFLLCLFQLFCFAAAVLFAGRAAVFAKAYFYPLPLCACAAACESGALFSVGERYARF